MRLFRDEDGFTTTSMALSILITLSLVFTAAQVYRVNSIAAEVQDVADAAALAAENQVAEFMVVARFCDAVVLSLSLSGIAVCGLGIAALCTPATATLSEGLIDAGANMLKARDQFSDRAKRVLDKLQEALPFFAAACAAGVSVANDADSQGSRYQGIALLAPTKGEPISADAGRAAGELVDEIEGEADDIRDLSEQAEEAAKEANEAKWRAFMRDCGDNPNYCMYERAAHLVGLTGSANPLFTSVDTWTFSTALARAQRYYRYRYEHESSDSQSVEDLVRCQLRIRFYRYAADSLDNEGYVHDEGGQFDAHFPHLPRNTDEMRKTSLYTEEAYPITEEPSDTESPGDALDGGEPERVMHAWAGCPGAIGEVVSHGSIAYMESADLPTCPICNFTAASLGKVAAASTSIENGFEYHYAAVEQAASEYQEARKRADGPKSEVERRVEKLLDKLSDALKEAAEKRIKVSPPGSFGAVAVVVNIGSVPVAGGFANGFVSTSASIGPCAAISASTLVNEGSNEGRTVLNSMIDGLREDGGAASGAAGIALDVWSRLLSAYSSGIDSLIGGVKAGLDAMPLFGASGLGTWAADKVRGAVEAVGLQPAELEALKPVLVNSQYVAEKDGGSWGGRLVALKQQVISHPLYSTDLFSALLTDAERMAIERIDGLGDSVQIASIELLGEGGVSIPVTIPLPQEVKEYGVGALQALFERVRSYHVEASGVRAWE